MIFDASMESMLEVYIYESTSLLEQLDEIILESEKVKSFSDESINEIFRIMHTIKGSSAMMDLKEITSLAHHVEDMFYIIRENIRALSAHMDTVFDLVLQCSDYFKHEMEHISEPAYESASSQTLTLLLSEQIKTFKTELNPNKPQPVPVASASSESSNLTPAAENAPVQAASSGSLQPIRIQFEDGCQMEHLRAYMLINQLKECCDIVESDPSDPQSNTENAEVIIKNGLLVFVKPSDSIEAVITTLNSAPNVKSYEFIQNRAEATQEDELPVLSTTITPLDVINEEIKSVAAEVKDLVARDTQSVIKGGKQNLISVNQMKLDQLMDVVGEIVIAESMVADNPDLKGLQLDNFQKTIRQLRKLTDELQDISMSIRMVSLSSLFQKMKRITRDMSKKLDKEVELDTLGEETEIDKTIVDMITDPFMHMIRNAMDHAIESAGERAAAGKNAIGTITLSAQNIGGEIVMTVQDDGRGLDAQAILRKARANGILTKQDNEYSQKEIFQMIMAPGFSTNENVTEYSGRGVGMDVVRKNLEKVNGTISIDSILGKGTTFTIKIPLTLAIVEGLEFSVGQTIFTLPITSIRQTFKVTEECQIFHDTDGSEMILLRKQCYPILRLHRIYDIETNQTDLNEGTMILIENQDKASCIFIDEVIGKLQVVVKPFPLFLNRYDIKQTGLAGCTILGDSSISLILDANNLLANY